MTIRNANWYNSHASRRYPLDDNATGTGDDGARLKDDIIVDLHLRWPRIAGQYAYIGGITVTQKIITVVILAADTTTTAVTPTPLAAVTIEQPATRHRYYNVDPLYPGVGGFIAFGDPAEPFAIRFSTPRQGLLSPKVGRPYENLPIPSMRKLGRADGLVGLVKILGGRDVEVVKETVNYGTVDRAALIIRLTSPTLADNVLREYAGPCSARPESRSCRKDGVESINGVGPDCNGNIKIDFRNFTVGAYDSCGADQAGTTLDQDVGIDEVCAAQKPGAFPGHDYCAPSQSSDSASSESLSSISLSSASEGSAQPSSQAQECEDLPFLDRFEARLHGSWVTKIGQYVFVNDDSPFEPSALDGICTTTVPYFHYFSTSSVSAESLSSYACDQGIDAALQLVESSRRQVMVWEDCAITTSLGKKITTDIRLTNQAARINGGLVINHHVADPFTNPHTEYFYAELNRNSNKVSLFRFNGATFITENDVTPPNPFSLDDWFRLIVVTTDLGGGNVAIKVKVKNLTNPGWGAVQFTVATTRYGTGLNSFHGVGNNRSITRFSHWMIENA